MVFDPYQILGVRPDASTEEIRQTYRALARKYHPDLNPDEQAAEQFKEMGEAFAILSDRRKRALFDEFGEQALHLHFDPESARRRRQEFSETGPPPPRYQGDGTAEARPDQQGPESSDVLAPLEIDLATAIRGGELSVPSPLGGAALIIRLPPNVQTGHQIHLPGRGRPGRRGQGPGALILEVRVRPHPFFFRDGIHLHLELPLSLMEATRGASVQIPTPDGWLMLQVPAGSRGGERLLLQGRGLSDRHGQRGDLFVHLCLRLPDKLQAASRSLEHLASLYSEPVRRSLKL